MSPTRVSRHFLFWFFTSITFRQFHEGHTIYAGIVARAGVFKYMAYIESSTISCGGAVLDTNHILTAAHCVDSVEAEDLEVILGVINLTDPSRTIRRVAKIYIPRGYRNRKKHACLCYLERKIKCALGRTWEEFRIKNDIAVLKLTKAVTLGESIINVNLPQGASPPYCSLIEYAGWGLTENGFEPDLRYVGLLILSPERSRALRVPIGRKEFAAYDPSLISHISGGDSGNPLVEDNIVYGVTSRGICVSGAATTFTNVYHHLDFIKKAMSDIL